MPNDEIGFDTGIKCPNDCGDTLHTASSNRRMCSTCGYSEPNDPITTTTTKDNTHG